MKLAVRSIATCLLTIVAFAGLEAHADLRTDPSIRAQMREFVARMSREHGFDAQQLERLLEEAQFRRSILDAMSRPAERVVPWFEYRARFLDERRIAQGREFRATHAARLAALDDPALERVILGILGVETSYGRNTGRYRVLDALVTLGFGYPPRAEFFRSELEHFLLLTREESLDPRAPRGSYAGAMGAPQFIASSWRHFAADGDGDGRIDLWTSWPDVLASIANYLREHGWQPGEPVVVRARVRDDAAALRNDTQFTRTLTLDETVGSLRARGVEFETHMPEDAPALLVVADGADGPEYRVGFNNFYVITRYNRSAMYAMAVYDLGTAIAQE